jgi:hypothetical protein
MTDSSKKRRNDPGNSYFGGVSLRSMWLWLVSALTRLQELRKIRDIQKQKKRRPALSRFDRH